MSISIAVCQFAAGPDVEANTEVCRTLIAAAAAQDADLAVLPEASMYYDPHRAEAGRTHGQPTDGPFAQSMAEAAEQHRIAVLVGMYEQSDDPDRDLNTVLAFSANGEPTGAYRKIHLYDAFGQRESDTLVPGTIDHPVLLDIKGVTVGVLTCYDLRFPEAFRWVTDAGAEVIAVPSAWAAGPAKEDHWRTLVKARAIENTVYVAAAGQTRPLSCGQSLIVDPMGVELVNAGLEPRVASAVIDPQLIAAVRRVNPSLANRRFEVRPRS